MLSRLQRRWKLLEVRCGVARRGRPCRALIGHVERRDGVLVLVPNLRGAHVALDGHSLPITGDDLPLALDTDVQVTWHRHQSDPRRTPTLDSAAVRARAAEAAVLDRTLDYVMPG